MRGLRPTSLARCAWWSRFGSSRRSQTRIRCAAVMKPATNVQPDAGQGKGLVRTQNQPLRSPLSSSLQSSSSQMSSASASTPWPGSIRPSSTANRLPVGRGAAALGTLGPGSGQPGPQPQSDQVPGAPRCAPTRAPYCAFQSWNARSSASSASRGTSSTLSVPVSSIVRRICSTYIVQPSQAERCASKRLRSPEDRSPSRYAVTSSTSSRQFRWARPMLIAPPTGTARAPASPLPGRGEATRVDWSPKARERYGPRLLRQEPVLGPRPRQHSPLARAGETRALDRGLEAAVLGVERGEGNRSPLALAPCLRGVGEDAEDPRFQRGSTFEPVDSVQNRQPGFLDDILRHRGGRHEHSRDAQERRVQFSDQLHECLLVARPQSLYELRILRREELLHRPTVSPVVASSKWRAPVCASRAGRSRCARRP